LCVSLRNPGFVLTYDKDVVVDVLSTLNYRLYTPTFIRWHQQNSPVDEITPYFAVFKLYGNLDVFGLSYLDLYSNYCRDGADNLKSNIREITASLSTGDKDKLQDCVNSGLLDLVKYYDCVRGEELERECKQHIDVSLPEASTPIYVEDTYISHMNVLKYYLNTSRANTLLWNKLKHLRAMCEYFIDNNLYLDKRFLTIQDCIKKMLKSVKPLNNSPYNPWTWVDRVYGKIE
jgi:hypothetical protein